MSLIISYILVFVALELCFPLKERSSLLHRSVFHSLMLVFTSFYFFLATGTPWLYVRVSDSVNLLFWQYALLSSLKGAFLFGLMYCGSGLIITPFLSKNLFLFRFIFVVTNLLYFVVLYS